MNYENIQIIKGVFDNNPNIRNIILKKYGLVNEKNIDKISKYVKYKNYQRCI